jgi:hypothetical protein
MMRKGQAALEFLTTYGWAFLVILVMIGALAYFGVLNPKSFLPSRCSFGPEIDCKEATLLSADGSLKFRFGNNVGSKSYFNFNATYLGTANPSVNCSGSPAFSNAVDVGRVMEVTCIFAPSNFSRGEKAKFEVFGNYSKAGGSYNIPVKGEIYVEVR